MSSGILLALIAPAALPQHPVLKTRPREDREESNAARRVTLNVQVTDQTGNPVSDLRAEEFSLFDNHQPRRIVAFHPMDGAALSDATQVLILLDAVNTPAQALDQEKAAIFNYLAESHKPLPFPTAFVLWFNGHLHATPATTDRNVIGRAFVKLTRNIHSNACDTEQVRIQQNVSASKGNRSVSVADCRAVHFKDSVAALDGIAQQQMSTGGRTLLIWMGSGWPTVTNAELERLSPAAKLENEREFVTIMRDLRAAQVAVYYLNPGAHNSAGEDSARKMRISSSSGDSRLPQIAVAEFARRSGGRAITSDDLNADLRACIRDAQWYYVLSFNAPPAQNGGGEMHSLEIKVDRPGVEVRTMQSYYSDGQ